MERRSAKNGVKHRRNNAATKFQWLSNDEAWSVFDRMARQYLEMSGEQFMEKWEAGEFSGNVDRPEVLRVAMLRPRRYKPRHARKKTA